MEETKAVTESMDVFFDKLGTYADKLADSMVEKAPEAYNALLTLIQFKSGFDLLVNLLFIVLFVGASFVWFWGVLPKSRVAANESAWWSGEIIFFTGYLPIIIFSICAFVNLCLFLNFKAFLGLFYPEGYLALKALEAVGIYL